MGEREKRYEPITDRKLSLERTGTVGHGRSHVRISARVFLFCESVCTFKPYNPLTFISLVAQPTHTLQAQKATVAPPWLPVARLHRLIRIRGFSTLSSSNFSHVQL